MKKWIAAAGVILAITAAIPITRNNDGPPPSDRQPAEHQARFTENPSESRYCAELSRIAQVWKMEMNKLKGARSGSPMSVMNLNDSDSDATSDRLRSVHGILAAKREECKKLKPLIPAGEPESTDQAALAERRERLTTTLDGAVDALEKTLDGVEAMSIPRADRAATVRLWDQILTAERAGAGAVESIAQWAVDQLLADRALPGTARETSPLAPLASVLHDRDFSETLSRALFGNRRETLDDLALGLNEIGVVLEQSSEAIYVAAGESNEQRQNTLTILLGRVQRFESDAEMLAHAFGDYRRAKTHNFQDVGIALADFLLSKAIVEQHFDFWEPGAVQADRGNSIADVKIALEQISKLRDDLDRLAALRRGLEPIGKRLRCRFTKSKPLPPPRLAIETQLDRAIQATGWLERVALSYSIYDASRVGKE